jgi:L-ribulokinase
MAEHSVPVERVINAGGIPQHNAVLNQVYANVLNKPVVVPDDVPTSLGSGIFAFVAAGIFGSVEEAQKAVCLGFKTYMPQTEAVARYERLYNLYRKVYFSLGSRTSAPAMLGEVLPDLRRIAEDTRNSI